MLGGRQRLRAIVMTSLTTVAACCRSCWARRRRRPLSAARRDDHRGQRERPAGHVFPAPGGVCLGGKGGSVRSAGRSTDPCDLSDLSDLSDLTAPYDPLGRFPSRGDLGRRSRAHPGRHCGILPAPARHQDHGGASPPFDHRPMVRCLGRAARDLHHFTHRIRGAGSPRESARPAATRATGPACASRWARAHRGCAAGAPRDPRAARAAPQGFPARDHPGRTVTNYLPEELQEEPLLHYSMAGPYTAGHPDPDRTGADRAAAWHRARGRHRLHLRKRRDRSLGVLRPPAPAAAGILPDQIASALAGARMVQALGEERRGTTIRAVVLRDQPGAYEDLEHLPIRASSRPGVRAGRAGVGSPRGGHPGIHLPAQRRPQRRPRDHPAAGSRRHPHRAAGPRVGRLDPAAASPRGGGSSSRPTTAWSWPSSSGVSPIRGAIAFRIGVPHSVAHPPPGGAVGLVMGSTAVAIAGTALGLYLLRIPANLLTLAGLGMGIGILVTTGVIVVERLRLGATTPRRPAPKRRAGLPRPSWGPPSPPRWCSFPSSTSRATRGPPSFLSPRRSRWPCSGRWWRR